MHVKMVTQTLKQAFTITLREKDKKSSQSANKAGIYDEELCKDGSCSFQVDSIRNAFRPLGVCAKLFGLFPCYDLSFASKLEDKKLKLVHVLDYCYTALICLLMAAGVVICTINRPAVLYDSFTDGEDKTDYYVVMASIYINMFIGLMSLFIFPKSWSQLLQLLDHFANLDKIFLFDGRQEEREFSRRILIFAIAVNIILCIAHYFVWTSQSTEISCTVYLMIIMLCLAGTIALIPTCMVIFFIHAIHLRQKAFNKKLESLLSPLTPCCFACADYSDFGVEICNAPLKENQLKIIAADLEKMRILYSEIKGLAGSLGCLFGSHLVREFITCLSGLIIYSYLILFLRDDRFIFWFFYIGLIIYIGIKLFTMACYAQHIICEVKCISNNIGFSTRISCHDATITDQEFNTFSAGAKIEKSRFQNIYGSVIPRLPPSGQFRTKISV